MTEIANSSLRSTFPKSERLNSKKLIEELFNEGSYFYLYPFKVTYLKMEEVGQPQVLFSVSKRKFKSAVTRNRIKRLMKEAYRLNKNVHLNSSLVVAFIYTPEDLPQFQLLNKKIGKALQKLSQL